MDVDSVHLWPVRHKHN
uniref:Uncharacterized protein n=1 Tax=Anguilla anguilla TaxID=7936 RepID=A0A0E9SRI3_ANGAN